jgi:hypothetical protein
MHIVLTSPLQSTMMAPVRLLSPIDETPLGPKASSEELLSQGLIDVSC